MPLNTRKVTADRPARLVIYGPPGLGKTSLAAEFPAPVFAQTEDGNVMGLEFDAFPEIESFDQLVDAMADLIQQPHDYQTFVLDSLTALETIIFAEVCRQQGWQNIESPGFKQGYGYAKPYWDRLVNGAKLLRNMGMTVIFIGHSRVEKSPNPSGPEFPKWDVGIDKVGREAVVSKFDAVLMVNSDMSTTEEKGTKKAKASGSTLRWIHSECGPAMNAKNRYNIPPKLLYEAGNGYNVLSQYLPVATQQQPQEMEN